MVPAAVAGTETRIGTLVLNAVQQIIPKCNCLKQQGFMMSQSLGVGDQVWLSWVPLAQALSWGYRPDVRLGCISSKVSTRGGSTFRSSRWFGRIQTLTSSRTQFLAGCGPGALLRSLPPGSLHRAAHNMAAASLRVRGWEGEPKVEATGFS